MKDDLTTVGIWLGCFVLGLMVGVIAVDNLSRGDHQYHAVKILSQHDDIVIRAVESPSAIDDRTVETIIHGVMVSRSHPKGFDSIWDGAK